MWVLLLDLKKFKGLIKFENEEFLMKKLSGLVTGPPPCIETL
jgi:hypothetical protein